MQPSKSPSTAAPGSGNRSHLFLLTELVVFSIGLAGCLIMQVDRASPKPYMDEVFHAPMAQKYCRGVYTDWDPKITTPPGLYALSSGLLRLTALLNSSSAGWLREPDCSLYHLRLTNLVFFAANFIALYAILSSRRLYGNSSGYPTLPPPRIRVLKAFCLSLLPVSFFFVSLFYTDQASLACLLWAYYMHLNEHSLGAGLFSCLAILCRQTNAVWVLFLLGDSLERDWLWRLRGLVKRREESEQQQADDEAVYAEDSGIVSSLGKIAGSPVAFVSVAVRVLVRAWPLAAVLTAFGVFVWINGGIVLGDKAAHEARLHTPQLMYFLAFAVAMHPTALLSLRLPDAFGKAGLVSGGLVCCLCCLAVRFQTFEHPYLLADNRHLTFYLWRRVFQRHWTVRYLLVPAYAACLGVYWRAIGQRSSLFRLALLVCTALALVPAALIEPRYFIAPWILWRLSANKHDSVPALLAEIAYFAGVNAFTFWLFLKRPFYWPDVAEPQRFIW